MITYYIYKGERWNDLEDLKDYIYQTSETFNEILYDKALKLYQTNKDFRFYNEELETVPANKEELIDNYGSFLRWENIYKFFLEWFDTLDIREEEEYDDYDKKEMAYWRKYNDWRKDY